MATPTRSVSEEAPLTRSASEEGIVQHQPPRAGRDPHGRFSKGCRPGPGRPPKKKGCHSMNPADIYMATMALEDAITAWQSVVARNGPAHARQLLKSLEAEHGPILYRDVALAAIKAAEAGGPLNPGALQSVYHFE